MPQANPGYLFYSKYFNLTPAALVNTDAIERLKNIETLSPIKRVIYSNANNIGGNTEPFKLVTTYPGLLIGSGYSHDVSKGMEGENALKIGFYFDHTTGMPVIPGSSIKGAVRGWFPSQYKKRAVDDSFRNPRYELISHLINNITSIILNHENAEDRKKIDMFEKEMFEGVYENKPKTIYNRDIFFDAVPVEIQSNFKSSQGRLFYNDYLTPHKNRNNSPELDPFSDPNPIQFLKVMPNVVYEFKFDLRNSVVIPEIDASKKRTLIQDIILYSGLGAKTNVGYGQFVEFNERHSNNNPFSDEIPNSFNIKDLPANSEGRILAKNEEYVQMVFNEKTSKELKLSKKIKSLFSIKERESSSLIVNINDPVVISQVTFDGTNLICQIRIKKS